MPSSVLHVGMPVGWGWVREAVVVGMRGCWGMRGCCLWADAIVASQPQFALCRDAVRRVWDWLDMSLSREPSTGSAGEAVAFGQLHLCEASPATTVGTTTLDVLPGDAGEPCVSSLPDGTVRADFMQTLIHAQCCKLQHVLCLQRTFIEREAASCCLCSVASAWLTVQ